MIIKSFSINYEKLFNLYKLTLIYGENYHLKHEIVTKLTNIFKNSSYKTILIKQEDLLKNIQIFDDYLNQDSLFGEKQILIIKDITDKLFDYVNIENIEKKIILLSENLQKKSKIRNEAEKNKEYACIPCYEDDEKTLKNILLQGISEIGFKISNENLEQLFNINKLNRSDINSGIEKLKLISKEKKVTNEILVSLFNTTSSFDVFQISNVLLSLNIKELNKILSSFYHFSFNFNEIIGPLKYKINKLINIYNFDPLEKKISILIDKFRPPIFWKEKNVIQVQMSKWTKQELVILLEKINQIEIMCKTNYEISETMFNKFLLDVVTKKVLINTYFSR